MRENKKVLLFAGTTEGRLLAGWLAKEGCHGAVCIATEYGRELLERELSGRKEMEIFCGRLAEPEMEELLERIEPGLVIDATHPYAAIVTDNLKRACSHYGKARYLRCLREGGALESMRLPGDDDFSRRDESEAEILYFKDMNQAVEWLEKTKGNILVTTGSKELSAFCRLRDYRERVYARVLPLEESISICRRLGYEGRHIIGMQGPFSEEMNLAQLREYHCRFLVTKDGGKAGGFSQKLQAAGRAGAMTVVICRPQEEGLGLEEVKTQVKEWLKHEGTV